MNKDKVLSIVADIRREYDIKRLPLLGKKLLAIEEAANEINPADKLAPPETKPALAPAPAPVKPAPVKPAPTKLRDTI